MREPRYRFSDDVRATTRAIALRMIHAGTVATSTEELEAAIARTDDIRERLTKGGYGSAFTAADLFPLYEGFVARATAAAPSRAAVRPPARPGMRAAKWLWIVLISVLAAVLMVAVVAGS